jgi:hypothetical protein
MYDHHDSLQRSYGLLIYAMASEAVVVSFAAVIAIPRAGCMLLTA